MQKAAEQGTTEVNGKEEKVEKETEEQIEVGEEQNEVKYIFLFLFSRKSRFWFF